MQKETNHKKGLGKNMVLDFEEMRRIYRLEKSTSRLVDVPEDFLVQLHALIDGERKKYFDSLKDLNATRARDFGNLKKLVDEWFLVREKKLLNTVLVCARLEEMDQTHMAFEEKKMFEQVFNTLMAHRLLAKQVLEANGEFVSLVPAPKSNSISFQKMNEEKNKMAKKQNGEIEEKVSIKQLETIPPSPATIASAPTESLSIRTLAEIPSFVGTDLKEYGPYKQGQTIELPSKIAQLFISRKLGENV